ncbi:MAG TPA: hypothetical protein VEV84_08540 [Pyrinomonadaceae bacterium]|nr:hypothetical protein [Pyrinomonadaceae bacterium]
MKKIIRVLAILCVLLGVGAIVSSAQINTGAKVSVPFSFQVGGRAYDAGEYNVRLVRSGISTASLSIQQLGTNETQTVLLREFAGESNDQFKLVFGEEGGNKFLAGIATGSNSYLLVGGPEASAETLTEITKKAGKSKM